MVSSILLVSSQCLALGTKSNIYEQNPTQSDSSALDYECDLKVTPSLCSSAQVAVTTPDQAFRIQACSVMEGGWVAACSGGLLMFLGHSSVEIKIQKQMILFNASVKLAHLPGQSVMTQTETESSCLADLRARAQ